MAASTIGRVIYIDAPGTYLGLLERKTAFTLGYVHVLTDGTHPARLTVYGSQEPDPSRLLFDSTVRGEDEQCDWSRGRAEEGASDSTDGITVILSGEGARAFVYRG